ncbi:MAG TPA: M43 family zinc metalloprotease, partial [Chitinophaga sp.]
MLLLLLLLPFSIYAQEGMPVSVRPCGTDKLLAQMRKNPAFLEKERAINQVLLQKHYKTVSGTAEPDPAIITLPVVFHIVNEDPNAYPDADVIAALQRLNDAYSASGTYAGGRTDTKIQFCLARTAPDGGRTTGIVRHHSYLSDFDVEMEKEEIPALGTWDRNRYINIWVVDVIRSELMQDFYCGIWTRLTMAGYGSAGGEIVVAGQITDVMAHEMGHYLSLAHTFAERDCKNDDCLTDGDMICDTPPEKTITGGFACNAPPNSCSTDALSGFTTDVPDLPDNFMDYGVSGICILGFTPGQAERMRNFITSALQQMMNSTVCNEPCAAAVTAAITRDIIYPVIGDQVTFTAAAGQGQTLQWLVDGTPVGTGPTYRLTVTEKRTYLLELRVTDNASGCHATAHDAVQVSCGVVARFYPNKRKIASKEGIETDNVIFTNRSRNATSWKWLISNDKGMAEQVVSTAYQLTYVFNTPGNYKVRLYATDGHCEDTTDPVTIMVDDPTPDGIVYIKRIDCYQQGKLKVELYFENKGYMTIPKNTPVTFYDGDPRTGNGHRLGAPFLLPDDLPGKCTSNVHTAIVDAGRPGTDTLVAVFIDNGSTSPLSLPNTGLEELDYDNNLSKLDYKLFAITITATPEVIILPRLANVTLHTTVSGGTDISYLWEPQIGLSCTDCPEPVARTASSMKYLVTATNEYNCSDTATVYIKTFANGI